MPLAPKDLRVSRSPTPGLPLATVTQAAHHARPLESDGKLLLRFILSIHFWKFALSPCGGAPGGRTIDDLRRPDPIRLQEQDEPTACQR